MQILQLELNHSNFYCPATGVYILKEGEQCNEAAPSLMAYWVEDVIEEPLIKDTKLAKAWEEYLQNINDNEEVELSDCLEDFLADYPEDNWVVFKITQCSGMHGQISTTVWFVINKEVGGV